jgi:hypothetical protein
LFDNAVVEKEIVAVDPDGRLGSGLGGRHARDVIEVGVSQQNGHDRRAQLQRRIEQRVNFVAGIDQNRVSGRIARDQISVFEKWGYSGRTRQHVRYDLAMVLA